MENKGEREGKMVGLICGQMRVIARADPPRASLLSHFLLETSTAGDHDDFFGVNF